MQTSSNSCSIKNSENIQKSANKLYNQNINFPLLWFTQAWKTYGKKQRKSFFNHKEQWELPESYWLLVEIQKEIASMLTIAWEINRLNCSCLQNTRISSCSMNNYDLRKIVNLNTSLIFKIYINCFQQSICIIYTENLYNIHRRAIYQKIYLSSRLIIFFI